MRLMHLGLEVHVVGEATAPAPTPQALLLAFSGSGETLSTCEVVTRAAGLGIPIFAVTADPTSRLARASRETLVVPSEPSDFPLGTLFEDASLLLLDGVVAQVMEKLGETEHSMRARHAIMV
jgi:6-phospho-3-hexuloisomerase